MNKLRERKKQNFQSSSEISAMHLDGGLSIRGYKITDLAKHCIFEELIYLLLFKCLPTQKELKQTIRKVSSKRILPKLIKTTLEHLPKQTGTMDILRIITILLGSLEPESKDNDKYEVYYRLQGILGPGLLYWYHYANFGIKIKTETHEDDCIAVNFLKLYHRTDDIDPLHIKIMNIILVIASENTHNSSTSAARLTISTKSDLHSCIVSGMNTFKGPLHGGAVERSIKFLLSLKSIEHSNQVLQQKWKKKEIVYGFGHSYYSLKQPDPRVILTQVYHEELSNKKPFGNKKLIEIAQHVEKRMVNEKNMICNGDFSNCITFHQLGFSTDFFLPVQIISRTSGWYSNMMEQRENGKILYIYLEYNGPKQNKKFPEGLQKPKL